MDHIGLYQQISRNNRRSVLLLIAFPALILFGLYAVLFFSFQPNFEEVNYLFLRLIPFVLVGVAIWFFIAFKFNTAIINHTTKAKPLERTENMRVYNLTENLCISVGMKMPDLFVINSNALNAFASGINEKNFAVTLTSGIINQLDDDELEGVIAHELTHIRNRDVRLLIISIIFVGIFGFLVEILFRSLLYGGGRKKDSKIDGRVMMIALIVGVVVYFFSILFKFSLSRKREYLADAGAVEMTKNSMALASALRKISGNHDLDLDSEDVKQMFIENTPKKENNLMASISGLFATHPPIEKRIAILERGL